MIRSFNIRLKPTRRQAKALDELMGHLCDLYNAALQERRDAWRTSRKRIGRYDQHKQLTALRQECPEYAAFPVAMQRDPLNRVDLGFNAFFRRVRQGGAPGYPRFRSGNRYDSFTVGVADFRIDSGAIYLSRLGHFGFKTRAKLRGTPKTLHVRRCGSHWNATVACEIGAAPERVSVSSAIGVDVGLTSLATLSDGTVIDNPRWTKRGADRLAAASRSLARKRQGSNRIKAREHLRRVHQRIAGLRSSYLSGVVAWLVKNYDLIAYEKMPHGHN